MNDLFILEKYFPDNDYSGSLSNHPIILASLYDEFYCYGDWTVKVRDIFWNFSDFPSSPFIEMLKQNVDMQYFIQEYFLSEDIYSESEVESNKTLLMTFFIKINNLFRRRYLINSDSEEKELYKKIHDTMYEFAQKVIPWDKLFNSSTLSKKFVDGLPKWPLSELLVFYYLMMCLDQYCFNRSICIKDAIFSIILKNIIDNWELINRDNIRHEIETILSEEFKYWFI